MAIVVKKKTAKSLKPKVKEASDRMAKRVDHPAIRVVAKKVAKKSFQDRLQIFVKAWLMTAEKARSASKLAPRAPQSSAKKSAAKSVARKSSC
jgi:hypothetical protein